jgi:hypothetical protein
LVTTNYNYDNQPPPPPPQQKTSAKFSSFLEHTVNNNHQNNFLGVPRMVIVLKFDCIWIWAQCSKIVTWYKTLNEDYQLQISLR